MTTIHFRAGGIDLELRGSEDFVLRQLRWLSPSLGPVDPNALNGFSPSAAIVEKEASPEVLPAPKDEPEWAREPDEEPEPAVEAEAQPVDELVDFFRSLPPLDRDHQAHAALVFAYHLQKKEGMSALRLGDLLRCCIRAGVDSRNFHRALGVLTRRGLLAEVRRGESYRITDQGVATIEERLA
jgi:hypothetical protein